jgi:hypothetical protein
MLEENIGDCPDFQCEFLKVASMTAPASLKSHANSPPFIGVIACGPLSMVQSINKLCKSDISRAGSPCFLFTKIDWEW